MMKFRLFLWAPVIVLTAFLASCGSNGIDNSTGRTTSATAATPQSSVAQLSGTLVFSASGTDPADGNFFVAGSLTSDGKGNVTGVEDLNLGSGVDSGVAFTGTYTVDSAKNVTLTLSDGTGTPTFLIFPIPSGSNSVRLNYDGSGTGTVQAQSTSNFSNAGTFAFSLNGEGEGTVSGSGNFITGSAGQFASGSENYQDGSYARNTAALGGQLSPAFDGGRGIAVIGPNVFSYYVVSQNQIILAGLETDSLLYGTAMKQ